MILKFVLFFLFFFILNFHFSQDSTFVKSFFGGSTVKVPENCVWEIKRAFIGNGEGYQIHIANSNFKESYQSSELLFIPHYIAEMELLTDPSTVYYLLTIFQKKIK
jgi:hypothetical protein